MQILFRLHIHSFQGALQYLDLLELLKEENQYFNFPMHASSSYKSIDLF